MHSPSGPTPATLTFAHGQHLRDQASCLAPQALHLRPMWRFFGEQGQPSARPLNHAHEQTSFFFTCAGPMGPSLGLGPSGRAPPTHVAFLGQGRKPCARWSKAPRISGFGTATRKAPDPAYPQLHVLMHIDRA
ncbi:hypothetical protein NDU88_002689 [Pleurodeles waltl]|uniref:Uncharacterized protein n=1 Tax=Pleurodeles waltl TaxID=8319 RepID=A0AAV7UDT3_PLEWA|nr:hypothetical protein NDU88_002689 [Pleurodeles waltl]